MISGANPLPLHFDAAGLIPVVIQDADRDDVLMVGFMNEEALAATRSSGRVHFWSRSRNALWRKGETSGHEQIVESIAVNCELNSLLVRVHQIGAVCHDGYESCYYRELEPDNHLETVRERVFDPARVYGRSGESDLATLTRALWAAYTLLRENDLAAVSTTSRRLREPEDQVTHRIAEEISELAGVLNGTHRHRDLEQDVTLEASQVIYWVILASLRRSIGWSEVRPDRALVTTDAAMRPETVATLLDAERITWERSGSGTVDFAAMCHATLSLVAAACVAGGVEIGGVILADLDELKSKASLQPFLTGDARVEKHDPPVPVGGSAHRVSFEGTSTERASRCP